MVVLGGGALSYERDTPVDSRRLGPLPRSSPTSIVSGDTVPCRLWGLLRIPAKGRTAAHTGYTAIGREEGGSQLDGQTLVAGLITLLESTATTCSH